MKKRMYNTKTTMFSAKLAAVRRGLFMRKEKVAMVIIIEGNTFVIGNGIIMRADMRVTTSASAYFFMFSRRPERNSDWGGNFCISIFS